MVFSTLGLGFHATSGETSLRVLVATKQENVQCQFVFGAGLSHNPSDLSTVVRHSPWMQTVHHFPTGRGGGAKKLVPENPEPD
jgi:hypothetical protein